MLSTRHSPPAPKTSAASAWAREFSAAVQTSCRSVAKRSLPHRPLFRQSPRYPTPHRFPAPPPAGHTEPLPARSVLARVPPTAPILACARSRHPLRIQNTSPRLAPSSQPLSVVCRGNPSAERHGSKQARHLGRSIGNLLELRILRSQRLRHFQLRALEHRDQFECVHHRLALIV